MRDLTVTGYKSPSAATAAMLPALCCGCEIAFDVHQVVRGGAVCLPAVVLCVNGVSTGASEDSTVGIHTIGNEHLIGYQLISSIAFEYLFFSSSTEW